MPHDPTYVFDFGSTIIVIEDSYTDYEIKAVGEAEEFWAFTEHIHRPAVAIHADRLLRSFNDLPI